MKQSTALLLTAIASCVLAAGLYLATRRIILFPLAVAVASVPVLVAAWNAVRRTVREYVEQDPGAEWLAEPPPALSGLAAKYDAELRELGYRPEGFAAPRGAPGYPLAVYVHDSLPVYVRMVTDAASDHARVVGLYFDSFFEDGGRLLTTSQRTVARIISLSRSDAPRLAQLRVGGTPTALDGQHLGTLKAWMAGGRTACDAAPELLFERLREDHETMRRILEVRGWVPIRTYFQWIVGLDPGVLKW